jgi:hypothetical protein
MEGPFVPGIQSARTPAPPLDAPWKKSVLLHAGKNFTSRAGGGRGGRWDRWDEWDRWDRWVERVESVDWALGYDELSLKPQTVLTIPRVPSVPSVPSVP